MLPTLTFVKTAFARFNHLIFNGELPEPVFRLTHARTFQGKLCYKREVCLGRTRHFDFEMRISLEFDLAEADWEDVVIHEMIHLHIASKGLRDSSTHGPLFRSVMDEVNRRHGRHITVSARAGESGAVADSRVRGHYMCIAKFSDGRLGVAPVAKSRIFELWNMASLFPDVTFSSWIGSTDTWFNRYPRVMRPKFYMTDRDELRQHLRGALRLVMENDTVRALNLRLSPDELLP